LLKFEPKFRLRRRAIIPKREGSRKGWKEVKSKLKKTRGAERTKIYMSRKTDKREVIRA
jgi:small subunit ribosomal protein S24e